MSIGLELFERVFAKRPELRSVVYTSLRDVFHVLFYDIKHVS